MHSIITIQSDINIRALLRGAFALTHRPPKAFPETQSTQDITQNAPAIAHGSLPPTALSVSVIVPAYNSATFLPRCLQSIFAQSWQNLQVIVVNDGSDDGTDVLLQQYQQQESRLEVCHHAQALGVACARNAGLKMARGEYVVFVDADDYLHRQAIEKMLTAALQSGADYVVSGYYRCKNTQQQAYADFSERTHFNHASLYAYIAQYLKRPYAHVMLVHCWGRMYKRAIIAQHGICFPAQLSQFEDVHFNFQYLQHIAGLMYLPEPLYYYQMHAQQSLSQKMGMESDFLARSRMAFAQIPLYLQHKQGIAAAPAHHMVEQALTNMWLVSLLRLCRRFKMQPDSAVYRQVVHMVATPDFQNNLVQFRPQAGESVMLYWACRTRLAPLVLLAGLCRLGFIRLMARGKV